MSHTFACLPSPLFIGAHLKCISDASSLCCGPPVPARTQHPSRLYHTSQRTHRTAPHRPRLHRYKEKTGYLLFRGIIFISIFANPRPELRAAVATFQKEQLGPRYVAVHLRKLEPLTVAFLKDVRRRGQEVVDEMREQYVMSPEYVTKKRAEAGLGDVAVFVGTDNKREDLTESLVAQLGARRLSAKDHPLLKDTPETLVFASSSHREGMDEAIVDFLLMMGSTLFLGNDASTVSWNVVASRRTRGVYSDNIHGPDK